MINQLMKLKIKLYDRRFIKKSVGCIGGLLTFCIINIFKEIDSYKQQ